MELKEAKSKLTIKDIPAEDRVRLERVCSAWRVAVRSLCWSDFRCFIYTKIPFSSVHVSRYGRDLFCIDSSDRALLPLLGRCGNRIVAVNFLGSGSSNSVAESQTLLVIFQLCPNL
ncbi:unnamed protein product, partial [Soboliphyme baturini]|uniref:F-box domain-containing protein n=1 Tax=Soboliphyme baturini TaxID=241478 RepID=A0A183JA37_9BILA